MKAIYLRHIVTTMEQIDCFENQVEAPNEGCTVQDAPYGVVNSSYIYRSENKLVISYLDLSLDGYGDIYLEEWFNYGVQITYIPEGCRPSSVVTG